MNYQSNNRLIFLWCIPRSISTAFEKMMACSGQFRVYGEPFIDIYKRSLLSQRDFDIAQAEFDEVFETLISQSHHTPVFVKDMAYHAAPFIGDRHIQSVMHTFLIRDPNYSIPSLFKMRPEFSADQPGFEGQSKLFNRVKSTTGNVPYVMDAEVLKSAPDRVVPEYFDWIGHEFSEALLTWSAGAREEWRDREAWHTEAINSRGFENRANETSDKKRALKVIDSIERNTGYYRELKSYMSQTLRG